MSFLYPAFLIGALAAAIPIVLHLLRRDVAPEVPFTAVRLLRQSPIERSKRRRLRDLLLLAARVAAVLLLAAAFARPYAPAVSPSGTLIVAVDRSYSMGGPGRFERALELARDAVREAGASETVAVLAFDDRAEILAPPGSRADARAALGRLEAGFGGTRYGPVVDRAVEVAERAGGGRLIFVTDLQRAGWDDELPVELPAGWRVEVRDTGAVAVNAAVASVAVESDRVVATIANTGTSHREGQVRVEVDGRLLGTGAFSAEAGDAADVPLEVRPPDAGVLSVSIDDPGGIPADDKRFVVLGASDAAKVAIIGSGSRGHSGFYLARALDASRGERGGLEAVLMSGTSLAQVTGGLRREEYAAVALLSTRGLDRKAREELAAFVRAGGGLLLCASPELEGSVLSTVFQWNPPLDPIEQGSRPLALAATDPRHPIFRPFGGLSANLGQVSFDRVWRVASRGWDVVARFTDGTPAVLERDVDEGRVVLFASDV
ncbi:MAG TPA: BatA domain-containing protein, partial [Vicinamibacterales bacterium]|nr:BatA domain-containing protein [Vicinamibacterales bacterium]